jgi:hypothetical protein
MKFNFNKYISCITIILVIIFSIDFAISTEEFKHSNVNNSKSKKLSKRPGEKDAKDEKKNLTSSIIKAHSGTDPTESVEGKVLKTITDWRDLFYEVARENMKGSDLKLKAKANGVLSSSDPAEMRSRAFDSRKNNNIFGHIMNVPVEVYRSCIYPFNKVNYKKWCANVHFGNAEKSMNCKLSFCNVCCDNLSEELAQLAMETSSATNLEMSNNDLLNLMKEYIQKGDKVKECKNKCFDEYPAVLPVSKNAPSRDPTLGTENNPARDCADIKRWGSVDTPTGKYFVHFGTAGKTEVFCDMVTDNGGWTLFFNYEHTVGSAVSLNATVSLLNNSILLSFNSYFLFSANLNILYFYITKKFYRKFQTVQVINLTNY